MVPGHLANLINTNSGMHGPSESWGGLRLKVDVGLAVKMKDKMREG